MYQIFKVCMQPPRHEKVTLGFFFHPRRLVVFLLCTIKKMCVSERSARSLSLCILYWFHLCPTFFFHPSHACECLAIATTAPSSTLIFCVCVFRVDCYLLLTARTRLNFFFVCHVSAYKMHGP